MMSHCSNVTGLLIGPQMHHRWLSEMEQFNAEIITTISLTCQALVFHQHFIGSCLLHRPTLNFHCYVFCNTATSIS